MTSQNCMKRELSNEQVRRERFIERDLEILANGLNPNVSFIHLNNVGEEAECVQVYFIDKSVYEIHTCDMNLKEIAIAVIGLVWREEEKVCRFNVGDKVRKNGKYPDRGSMFGMEFHVAATSFIGDVEVIWTEPSIGGAYAADGFDLVEKCAEASRGSSQL